MMRSVAMPVIIISHGLATGGDDHSGGGDDGQQSSADADPHPPEAKQITETAEKVKLHEQFQALLQGTKRKSQEMLASTATCASVPSSLCNCENHKRQAMLYHIVLHCIVLYCVVL